MSILGTIGTAMGIGTAGSGIAKSLGIGRKKAEKRQMKNQMELNKQAAELNYEYGEKSADNAFARQMEMYERSYQDESPAAKKKQLEDAGLSVGLMYSQAGGMGGEGTASTAARGEGAGNQQGGRAPNYAEEQALALQGAQLGLQMSRLKSEIKVNESVAEKNEAEAEATGGYRKDTAETTIGLLLEQTKNEKLKGIGIQYENTIKEVTAELDKYGIEERKTKIDFEADMAWEEYNLLLEEVQKARRENEIGKDTQYEITQLAKKQLEKLYVELAEKAIGIELSKAQIKGTEANTELSKAQIKGTEANIKGTEANIELTTAQKEMVYKEIRNYGAKLPPWTQLWNQMDKSPNTIGAKLGIKRKEVYK